VTRAADTASRFIEALRDGDRAQIAGLRVVVVAAHPDDEVLGLGTRLSLLRDRLLLIHVTDGAPRDMTDARRAGCATREEYAALRRRELEAALRTAGASADLVMLGAADQEASLDLAGLARRLAALLGDRAPDIVVTHPYEGGHPDHDAACFIVHAACGGLLGPAAPAIVEMASYHDRNGSIAPLEFLDNAKSGEVALPLTAAEQDLKRRLLACFATQQDTLQYFPTDIERFRPAPDYDFTAPPHAGTLFYERFGWGGMTGERWRTLAAEAIKELASTSLAPRGEGGTQPKAGRVRGERELLGSATRASRPLTILSVAYPLAPVSADAVGGAEQVLARLDAALTRAGHRSLVVACEGSDVAGTLIATPRIDGPLDEAAKRRAEANHRAAIEAALEAREPAAVDLIHLHGIDFHGYLPPPGPPALVTLHLPPSWYPPEALRPARPRTFFHCVSESQRRACPPGVTLLPTIENGVEVDAFAPAGRHAKRRFALTLGRICPEKGFQHALDAAARAGAPLLLAGQVYPYAAHEAYFETEIRPRLDQRRRFIGPVGFARKRRLLAAARCLLVPSLAPETSSLVAMEALASGTPVIAFPAGALPDIVEHGRTGFLVNDAAEMAEAIVAAGSLAPEACRAAARTRFSLDRTVARYLALYERLASGEPREDAADVA
jgi:glycosyltransferase involved in cell wall biosynthesis